MIQTIEYGLPPSVSEFCAASQIEKGEAELVARAFGRLESIEVCAQGRILRAVHETEDPRWAKWFFHDFGRDLTTAAFTVTRVSMEVPDAAVPFSLDGRTYGAGQYSITENGIALSVVCSGGTVSIVCDLIQRLRELDAYTGAVLKKFQEIRQEARSAPQIAALLCARPQTAYSA